MPDTIMRDAPSPAASLDQMWTTIGERYAELLEVDRIRGDASEESDAATERWFDAERKIIDIRGTSASLLLMKLELVVATGNHNKDGDFVSDALRIMIEDLRAIIGEPALAPYTTMVYPQ